MWSASGPGDTDQSHVPTGDGECVLVEDCTVVGNKLNGLLVRDGAGPRVLRNVITGNGAFGIVLQVTAALPGCI